MNLTPSHLAKQTRSTFSTLAELLLMLKNDDKVYLIPFVAILVMTSVLLVGISLVEYVAPFVYTIF